MFLTGVSLESRLVFAAANTGISQVFLGFLRQFQAEVPLPAAEEVDVVGENILSGDLCRVDLNDHVIQTLLRHQRCIRRDENFMD